MKPQTKLHHRVIALHKKLRRVAHKQVHWAYKNSFKLYAWKTKHKAACFECGHQWNQDTDLVSKLFDIKCPNCKKKLIISDTKKHSGHDIEYFKIFTLVEEFQVIRVFQIHHWMSKGYPASYACHEIYQHWLTDDGKLTTVARSVNAMGFNYSGHARWIYYTPMEVKNSENARYHIGCAITYPDINIRPIYKRNGFNDEFHGFSEIHFFRQIVSNPKFETLLKARQFSLMDYAGTNYHLGSIIKYWPQIKICMRNRFTVHNASDWFDHISLLQFFKMDIYNPKYICPTNFAREHTELTQRKMEIMERERIVEQKKKEYNNILFREVKKKLLNISFTDGLITIVPLKNVADFRTEQKILAHCVYTNNYHNKDTSLIMSARIEKKRLETIEISLHDFRIQQVRGYRNNDSDYHSVILKLLEKSMPKLKSAFEKKKQEVKKSVKLEVYAA